MILNTNLINEDLKLLPKEVSISYNVFATVQGSYIAFSGIPLHRADLYDLEFISQCRVGVEHNGYFSADRFTIKKSKNGFTFYTIDTDIVYFFQNGGIYEFNCTATLK